MYSKLLLDFIEKEKNGEDYICPNNDRNNLQNLLDEINEFAGTKYNFLAELDSFRISGIGPIIEKHIENFTSESIRGILLPHLVFDKIPDCDKIVLRLYLHFKNSEEYISKSGKPSPAHIYVRYDNAFKELRPKRLKNDLLNLAYSPRDAFYLPFTMAMLASWKMPEMIDLLIRYSKKDNINSQEVGLSQFEVNSSPDILFISKELRFIGISGLKYYYSTEVLQCVEQYVSDRDPDISKLAQKTLNKLKKQVM